VRGAPAIGVSAAFGIALGARRSPAEGPALRRDFEEVCEQMRVTRPTAVNLFWAIERMRRRFAREEPRAGRPCAKGSWPKPRPSSKRTSRPAIAWATWARP